MTGQQRAALAHYAMTMKQDGIEPTYGKVIAACPKAALNPKRSAPSARILFILVWERIATVMTLAYPGCVKPVSRKRLCHLI